MATIKAYTLHFAQSSGATDFKVEIKCSNGGLFSIKLPDDVAEVVEEREVRDQSLNGVEAKFRNAFAAYSDSKTKTRKVIIYGVRITAYICEDDGSGKKCVLRRDDVSFSNGATLSLSAAVYTEMEIARADGEKTYKYLRVESSIPEFLNPDRDDRPGMSGRKATNAIEWTEERERFFARLGLGMKSLMMTLDREFTDTKKLLKTIDSGAPLKLL